MDVGSVNKVIYIKDYLSSKLPSRSLFSHKYYKELSSKLYNQYFNEITSYVCKEMIDGFSNSDCVDLNISFCDCIDEVTLNMEASASAEVRFEFIKFVKKDLKDSGFYVFDSSNLDKDLMISRSFYKLFWHYITNGSFSFYITLFVVLGFFSSFLLMFLLNNYFI